MNLNFKRAFELNLPENKSAFLWGARKVGKTFWIKNNLKNIYYINLLESDTLADYLSRPSLLRERCKNIDKRIVIDEIQKAPALLDEVHNLIETYQKIFLLTGSSARKLKKAHANMLGGRAWKRIMRPLSLFELGTQITEKINLEKIAITGLLPAHLLSEYPEEELRAYASDYLKEEIVDQALVQNLPAFSEFLRVAAMLGGDLVNYTNVAADCGVSAKIVRSYFDILEDTYLGFRLSPIQLTKDRRLIQTDKFYLFDVGVSNYLAKRKPVLGTMEFGKSFEHLIMMELKAYQAYRNPELPIYFWRTSSGLEVDFILGEYQVAIEVKASTRLRPSDLVPLKSLQKEHPHKLKRQIIVSIEEQAREIDGIEVLPWFVFVEQLWAGRII